MHWWQNVGPCTVSVYITHCTVGSVLADSCVCVCVCGAQVSCVYSSNNDRPSKLPSVRSNENWSQSEPNLKPEQTGIAFEHQLLEVVTQWTWILRAYIKEKHLGKYSDCLRSSELLVKNMVHYKLLCYSKKNHLDTLTNH